ncbi:diacylglycerol kinase family protein [Tenuibacillus multivorans]|uniref:Undecaprenol kinase n=1 Tax=Tenuibacillus multivorans TaxID=237069 RepID=A0A1G9ZD87_9BACI|nr:diacylglycerol kinase family protein [Tenuibacillus multivorans]GEL78312.1 diacylglycerol kinase [Tenuibacillus multivorans]SDN19165.1 undecaprenol kinase [Tenuibacillus multivorans]
MRFDKIGLRHAVNGLFTALRIDRNVRTHFVFMIIVLSSGILFKVTLIEWLFLLTAIALVIITELINTAIEIISDQMYPDYNAYAKQIKDISAAAVLVAAIFAIIVGFIIFVPRIISIF